MKALIITDVQNDFCPGGALPVKDGDRIIPVVNPLQKKFDLVVAVQDWHPAGHMSFASAHAGKKVGDTLRVGGFEQTLWPDHCVQWTEGAEFADDLDMRKVERIFRKGTDPKVDSYSGFFDHSRRNQTGLTDYLRDQGVGEIFLVGLATDYCIKFTALDAVDLGFRTNVIIDAAHGIDLKPGDVDRAVEEMRKAGVRILKSGDL